MSRKLQFAIAAGGWLLVAIMPFHAFLAVWAGHVFGHETVFQSWKEAVVLLMCVAALALLIIKPKLWHHLNNWPNRLLAAFIVLSLVVSLAFHANGSTAFVFGVKTDLVMLAAFIVTQLVKDYDVERLIIGTILITSALVAAFGFVQIFLSPPDWLAQFGYGPSTIEPYRLVDPAVGGIRILSSLGGPNQLGEFLILPIALTVWLMIRRFRWWQPALFIAMAYVLLHSYSRSAWLGAAVAVALAVLTTVTRRTLKYYLAALAVVAIAAAGVLYYGYTHHGRLQYYLLHGRVFQHQVEGSDAGHNLSLAAGIKEAASHPLGEGLGTSGPASQYGPRELITENYYLQIAIETGWLGLVLFVAAEIAIGLALWHSKSLLGVPLAAALVGISIVNLFLHGWADSSTALVWWTTAGLTLRSSKRESSAGSRLAQH